MGLIKFLDWDSKFFGFNVGAVNISQKRLGRSSLARAILEGRAKKIRCLYLEIPFNSAQTIAYCSEKNFLLTDFRLTLTKTLSQEKSVAPNSINYKLEEKYYPALENIAIQISKQSRYAFDSRFGLRWSRKLYQEWLRKSFYENFCSDFIVYIENKIPVGFITLRVREGAYFIDLIGVARNRHGSGIGGALIDAAIGSLFKKRVRLLKVTTQGRNIKALSLYQGKGFKIESATIFYHKWLD